MGKDLEMGCRAVAASENEYLHGKTLISDGEKIDEKSRAAEIECDIENDEPSAPAADLMSMIANNNAANTESPFLDSNLMVDKTGGKTLASQELLFLELSLKQVGNGRTIEAEDHNPIRRSRFSAFTRY